jgi:hypothetical protein
MSPGSSLVPPAGGPGGLGVRLLMFAPNGGMPDYTFWSLARPAIRPAMTAIGDGSSSSGRPSALRCLHVRLVRHDGQEQPQWPFFLFCAMV